MGISKAGDFAICTPDESAATDLYVKQAVAAGPDVDSLPLAGGLYEHTLRGVGWAQRIPAGGTVRVGFNGRQGTPLGNAGTLTANQLFDGESPSD